MVMMTVATNQMRTTATKLKSVTVINFNAIHQEDVFQVGGFVMVKMTVLITQTSLTVPLLSVTAVDLNVNQARVIVFQPGGCVTARTTVGITQTNSTALRPCVKTMSFFVTSPRNVSLLTGGAMVTKTALTTQMKMAVLTCLNVTAMNSSVRTVRVFMSAGAVMAKRIAMTDQMN